MTNKNYLYEFLSPTKLLLYEEIKPQLLREQDFLTDNSRTNINIVQTFRGKRALIECMGEMDIDDCVQLSEMFKELATCLDNQ